MLLRKWIIGGKRGGMSGTCMKDTGTKPKGGRIQGRRWGWLGWEGVVGGEMETTILEQQLKKKKTSSQLYIIPNGCIVCTMA